MEEKQVKIVGRVFGAPILSTTSTNTYCCNFQVIADHMVTPEDYGYRIEELYYDVFEFGKHAKSSAKYLEDGLLCEVEGKLNEEILSDKLTGRLYKKRTIKAKNVNYLEYSKSMKEAYKKKYSKNM
jgi:single-stranded DNA-binding protein